MITLADKKLSEPGELTQRISEGRVITVIRLFAARPTAHYGRDIIGMEMRLLNIPSGCDECRGSAMTGVLYSCFKTGQHSILFLTIHLFLPIKYIFLFHIKDTVSDILSVLLNFIANYDSKNENIAPYCL